MRQAYATAGIDAQVSAFIDDMAAAYAWADLVVCRAGALTVAELAVVGVAAILVPFPHATDDHQTGNATVSGRCRCSHPGAAGDAGPGAAGPAAGRFRRTTRGAAGNGKPGTRPWHCRRLPAGSRSCACRLPVPGLPRRRQQGRVRHDSPPASDCSSPAPGNGPGAPRAFRRYRWCRHERYRGGIA